VEINSPCTEDNLKRKKKKHSGCTVYFFTNKNFSVQWTICYMGWIPAGQRKPLPAHFLNVVTKNLILRAIR